MTHPVLILVHPGSLAAHGGSSSLSDAIRELETHDGPIIIIDGSISDKSAHLDMRISKALNQAEKNGHLALRLWGCDSGEPPFEGWPGRKPSNSDVKMIHSDQEEVAKYLAPEISGHPVILSGAWATYDDTSGCVTSVKHALIKAGHKESITMSQNVIYEEDFDM